MKFWLTRLSASLVGCAILLGSPRGASADPDSDDRGRRVREISESVNSPFCPATTLASCGSPSAAQWRNDIRQWVDEGLTKNEICARLEERAQHKLCVGPRRPWMWGLPFLIAAASVGLLAFVLRQFVRPPTGKGAAPASPVGPPKTNESALDAQLDRELDELDGP